MKNEALMNLATRYTLNWIDYMDLRDTFKKAQTVEELKKMVIECLFKEKPMKDAFVKGAKLVMWESVLKALTTVLLLLLFPVVAYGNEVTLIYTLKSAGSSLVFSAPKKDTGETSAGGLSKKTQLHTISEASNVKTYSSSENGAGRKIARINPSKKSIVVSDMVMKKATPRNEIEQMICDIFGSDCAMALAICKAESGCREEAVGDGGLTYFVNGIEYGKSYGIFQIRHLPGRPSPAELLNAETNIKHAYGMFKAQGWQPWSVFTNKSYLKFL